MKSSTKISFLKLPVILTLSYWLMGLVYSIVMKIMKNDDIDLITHIFSNLTYTLYYGMPKYLLMIFVSTIALTRCNVHTMTKKNILLMVVLALILSVITHLITMFVAYPLLKIIFNGGDYMYYPHYLLFIFYRFVSNLIYFLIIGFVIYFGILSLQDVFERDLESVAITKDNSAKLHLALFIILFIFVLLSVLIPMFSYLDYNLFYHDANWIRTIVYVFSVMCSVVILYFLIRNIFSCSFAILQTGRLIKSTIFSTIFVFLFNCIIGIGVLFLIIIIAFSSRGGESIAIFLLISAVIIQFVVTGLIVRAVVRRYFSITYNKSIHNESTI